jgi:hypothetical protein
MSVTPSTPHLDEADFKKRLTDEYKILQDKIDKIGGFRFVIKGWSVTAVIAASAAESATRSLLTVVTISSGLVLMLFFFFLFEFEQVKLSRIFGARARRIEGSFRLMDRGYGSRMSVISAPYTAHETVESLQKQRLFAWRSSRASEKRERFSKRLANWWHIIRQADFYFYVALILIAFVLPLLPRYRTIETRWKQLTGTSKHSVASGGSSSISPERKVQAPVIAP